MHRHVLVFDIETVPDVASGRQLLSLDDALSDAAIADALFAQRQQQAGHSMLRHHLQKIVAISVIFHSSDTFKIWSLGTPEDDEKTLLQHFFRGLEKYTPTLVSWNGTGFDLPVIHYRALLHGISAPRYWEVGENDNAFRWNNYINRYHYRHLDVMDILAGYQPRNNARLDDIATMLGFPGKLGMDGSQVWASYQQNNLKAIRDYCETDVLNTFLIYLRFEHFRGNLSVEQYRNESSRVKAILRQAQQPHFDAFLAAWHSGCDLTDGSS